MSKKISVELERAEWGQVIDGLTCRAEQYELTAEYHRAEHVDGDILEVNSVEEAASIAMEYRRLIQEIENQLRDV